MYPAKIRGGIGCGDEQFYSTAHVFRTAVMLGYILFQKLCAISWGTQTKEILSYTTLFIGKILK